jgi:hypothetical protein
VDGIQRYFVASALKWGTSAEFLFHRSSGPEIQRRFVAVCCCVCDMTFLTEMPCKPLKTVYSK